MFSCSYLSFANPYTSQNEIIFLEVSFDRMGIDFKRSIRRKRQEAFSFDRMEMDFKRPIRRK
jgi:hypothetical protein